MNKKFTTLEEEISKRVRATERAAARKSFELANLCFPKQLEFIQNGAKRKTAVCSRRAGKTKGIAHDLIKSASSVDEGDFAYITLNRRQAKKIIWRDLIRLNKKYELGARPDNSELTLTFPTGVAIHVSGAKDESEIDKFRGLALRKAYIDEAQSFRPYIKDLIEDVLEPALIDYNGPLALTGTPGPVAAGYFYECSHNPEWSNNSWTIHDNPWILQKSGKTAEQTIEDVCKSRGVDRNHPSIRREFYGEWVYDYESLVYHFSKDLNLYAELPNEKLIYIVGIDLGYQDSDAIAVLGYSPTTNVVYLVEEVITEKQNITSLVEQIKEVQTKYEPVRMVMDAGGLGKKIQEEIRTRHGIHTDAADKTRKFEFIELLNDDLRTEKLKAPVGSAFEEDSYLVQWDFTNPEKPKVSDGYHTDIGDAVLYAWRECKHYFKQDVAPSKNQDEYMRDLEERESQAMAEKLEAAKTGEDVVTYNDLGVDDNDDFSDIF